MNDLNSLEEVIYESQNSIIYKKNEESTGKSKVIKISKQHDVSGLHNEFAIMEDYELNIGKSELIVANRQTSLVRDYIVGESLSQLVSKGHYGLDFFIDYALKIAEALYQIHLKKIIHKDLSAGNIIIDTQTKNVAIIDYEISTQINQSESSNYLNFDLNNNLPYISPEQTGRMNRLVDYRTDFYSLGICYFEMLTGKTPFIAVDPLEIVYAHLAQSPPKLSDLNGDVPTILDSIIQKLLSKNAEERYHSLQGLIYDLNKYFLNYKEKKSSDHFEIAANDIPAKLNVSQTLVGRDKETKILLDNFDLACQGKKVILNLSGFSGIGKTTLIRQTFVPLTKNKGIFLSGKYDSIQRNTPYSAIAKAINLLADLILSESEETLVKWRSKILAKLSSLSQVIIETNPKWKKIIGEQPPLPELVGKEWQNRLHFVFRNLIKVIATAEHPVVLFLDDCQWVDEASIELMKSIVSDEEIGYCMIVLAYRQNEIDVLHPLTGFFNGIDADKSIENMVCSTICLNQMNAHDCEKIIENTLQNPIESSDEFASLVFFKSEGNPYLINQILDYLYQNKSLVYNLNARFWEWNKSDLQEVNVFDNSTGILLSKLKSLPTETFDALSYAATFGISFSLKTLALIIGKNQTELHSILWKAVLNHLIIPQKIDYKFVPDFYAQSDIEINFKFSHDKIQQTLYAQIDQQERPALHYKIGMQLLPSVSENWFYETMNHFLIAKSITVKNGRNELLEKWLIVAAKKSFNAASFEMAFQYFNLYFSITNKSTVKADIFNLYLESALISSHGEIVEGNLKIALSNDYSIIDRASVYENIIRIYCADDKFQEAIKYSRIALLEYKIKLPFKAGKTAIIFEAIKTQIALPVKKLNEIRNMPEMKDDKAIALTRIMKEAALAFFFGEIETYPILIFKMVQVSAKYGNIPESMVAYSSYGIMLAGVLNNQEGAYILSKQVLEMMNQYKDQRYYAATGFVDGAFLAHWKEPLFELSKNHKMYYQIGLETGNTEYALFNYFWAGFYDFTLGKSMSKLITEHEKLLKYVQLYNRQSQYPRVAAWLQTFKNLMHNNDDRYTLLENEEVELSNLLKNRSGADYLGIFFQKGLLAFWYNDYSKAKEFFSKATAFSDSLMNNYFLPFLNTLNCITEFYLFSKSNEKKLGPVKKIYKSVIKKLDIAIKLYDGNLGWMKLFIESEYNTLIENKFNQSDYQNSIDAAKKNQFYLPALMIELKLFFHLKNHNAESANGRLKGLMEGFSQFELEGVKEYYFGNTSIEVSKTESPSQKQGNYSLDYLTIIKLSQALTSEILLDKLMHKLLSFAMENAGATFGSFLMKEKREFITKIEMKSKQSSKQTVFEDNVTEPFQSLPNSILNYVKQSETALVLEDAQTNYPYSEDKEIKGSNEKSVMCLPVIHKSELIGILYLSNDFTRAAFTNERTELIKMIAGQIGVSIENALLYSNLEKLVDERTEQLEKEKQKSEKLLLNILPIEVASELKQNGKAIPRKFDEVTVMFCDIKGFSMLAEKLSAEKLIEELDYCFSGLDRIIEKFKIEKIKTIGDAYMCASGVPTNCNDSYLRITEASIEIMDWMKKEKEKAAQQNKDFPEMRIGIHTGNLIAGIVGTSKFAYDIWGDTVNIAARMEQTGEVGEINISEQTYELIKNKFECEPRGVREVKNMAAMKMYFVKRKK
jgi:predicted ATPase/class 3 adenylate cyclase/predicted Ser/Thr protein kinase